MRILMLGNSFTYYNDLPKMLAAILGEEVVSFTRGGAYLKAHTDPEDEMYAPTAKALAEERWDYVVLQDQSRGPITHPAEFAQAVCQLCRMIRAAGGIPAVGMIGIQGIVLLPVQNIGGVAVFTGEIAAEVCGALWHRHGFCIGTELAQRRRRCYAPRSGG